MMEIRCPICERIILCKIDEAKGELEIFNATMEFARALRDYSIVLSPLTIALKYSIRILNAHALYSHVQQ